ncbi:MAG: DUF5666 domain-containing protein [Granulosicoccus sp.]
MSQKAFALILFSTLLCACNSDPGSGGGIGGTGNPVPIIATGVSVGSISDFGSIVINGQRFNTDNTAFSINEQSVAQSDMRIGMNVIAEVDFSSLTASSVSYFPTIIGPVDSISIVGNTLVSLQQKIIVNGNTQFDGVAFQDIAPGMVLEISGFRNAEQAVMASFIRLALDTTRVQLFGTILNNLQPDGLLNLPGLSVDISQIDISAIPMIDLDQFKNVLVSAPASSYNPLVPSLQAEMLRTSIDPMLNLGDTVEYEGIVSAQQNLYEFDVNWQQVLASSDTRIEYENGAVAELSSILRNSRLEVEGFVNDDLTLVATRIIIIAVDNSDVTGLIDQVDNTTRIITVMGVNIEITPSTNFKDESSFDQLRPGDYVEISASYFGTRMVANVIEVDEPDDDSILEGPVTSVDKENKTIDVINRRIPLGDNTEFKNSDDMEIDQDQFFDQVKPGDIVKSRWREFRTITSSPADDIEFE